MRRLTPTTSHGYHVIEFATLFLGIELYPWQKWLLIHALELRPDGQYRFRKIVVLVGRQNGKTTLLTVLALWWLFIDSDQHPEHLPAKDFLVLGTAQNLDLAEEAWERAVAYCDPDDMDAETRTAVPVLQAASLRPVRTNGKKALRLKSGARYAVRAANRKGGRGKAAARIIMDELREQQTWDAWGAISKTMNATWNAQLWGISNAGDQKSVVLRHLRAQLIATCADWDRYVASGIQSAEEFANDHDLSSALFEWSGEDGCAVDDPAAILQANPSIGYGAMTWETVMSDLATDPETIFRTEVLCQWVTAIHDTYLDGEDWAATEDAESQIAPDSRMVLGIDTAADRTMSYVGVAGVRPDGRIHVEAIAQRAGMLWLPDWVAEVALAQGITQVAVQARGCPAGEFVQPLKDRGLQVVEINGPHLGAATGRMRDRLRDRSIRHRPQPLLGIAVSGALTRVLGEVRVWDRRASAVDIAPLVAVANAAYALETSAPVEVVRSAYEDHDLIVI